MADQSPAVEGAVKPGRGADLARWFGEPKYRRPTVAGNRIEDLESAPPTAAPLTRSAAWFGVHAMLLGGVFSGHQVDQWLSVYDRRWPADRGQEARHSYRQRFLQPFFTPRFSGHPIAVTLRFPGGASYAHFSSRPAYAAIGVENSRYRRTAAMPLVMQRLLAYDYVLERPDFGWLGESDAKLELFDALDVPRETLPQRTYRPGAAPRRRSKAVKAEPPPAARRAWFPHHMPIGYAPWRVVFVLPCFAAGGARVAVRTLEYENLWRVLRAKGVRVSVVFVVRGGGEPGLNKEDVAGLAREPDSGDRERLFCQVERYILEHADPALQAQLDRVYQCGGSSRALRLRQLDGFLDGKAQSVEGRHQDGAPMDVSCFVSERLASKKWNVLEPAPVQIMRV